MRLPGLVLICLRQGLGNLRFNLAIAVITVLISLWWNREATADDLAVFVALPFLLSYLTLRASMIFLPRPNQPERLVAPPSLSKRAGMTAVWLLAVGFVVLLMSLEMILSLPLYAWFRISWAITGGLAVAGLLFAIGVGGLITGVLVIVAWPQRQQILRTMFGSAIDKFVIHPATELLSRSGGFQV